MYEIPIFPLDTVLFPGTPIHLHIFEPRYRLMINSCIESGRPFGVALIRRGLEAGGDLPEPFGVGCSARIVHLQPLEGGQMNLIAVGEERFRIQSLQYEKPYLVGLVEVELIEHPRTLNLLRAMRHLRPAVMRYLYLLQTAEPDVVDIGELDLPEDPLAALYLTAALLQIPAREKQPLLEVSDSEDLLGRINRLLARETALLQRIIGPMLASAKRAAWLN